jgi:hypothetical protein
MVVLVWLRWLAAGFPPWQPGLESKTDHVGFVVDKVTLGQVSSTNSHSTKCSILICHLMQVQVVKLMANIASGLSLISPHKIKKKKRMG